MNDYSQFKEQGVILDYFKDKQGLFLDIGAYDGKWCSNTHALALSGWNGYCIEANPLNFSRLVTTYEKNDDVELILATVVTDRKEKLTKLHLADCVSSPDIEHIKQFPDVKISKSIYTPVLTIPEIFSLAGTKFDFINIDVEGNSVELFYTLMKHIGVKCICVEADKRNKEITDYMRGMNYKLLMDNGVNCIFGL